METELRILKERPKGEIHIGALKLTLNKIPTGKPLA